MAAFRSGPRLLPVHWIILPFKHSGGLDPKKCGWLRNVVYISSVDFLSVVDGTTMIFPHHSRNFRLSPTLPVRSETSHHYVLLILH
ncbi:uncharacterized protein B0H64DRAFT_409916, partial [Chaetomium fimeti]